MKGDFFAGEQGGNDRFDLAAEQARDADRSAALRSEVR
jgi:hypothetical protein